MSQHSKPSKTSSDVEVTASSPYPVPSSRWAGFTDQFKRAEENDSQESSLRKDLSQRHIIMIALSTGVGTGLWVGTGKLLAKAGPASLLIGYAIISSMLFSVIDAAGELAVAYKSLPGGFNSYPKKFVDDSLGFAVGWNYAIQWLTVISLELVTATITIKYWTNVNSDIFVAPLYIVILAINFFGAKGYGEAEFVFNSTKLITIVGFVIMGIVIDVGGANNEYIGAKYWHNPGAFHNGFKGLCNVFVTATFAFGGTEFVALTAAEQSNPRRTIPQAIKIVGYRIIFIFMLALTIICFLVPYNSEYLMGSGSSATHSSPFVIAAKVNGVKVVPHLINAVILLSVLSVANSAVYSSSRTLHSLAKQGFAPKALDYIDKRGRPLVCLFIAAIAGLFSFIAAYKKEETVFNWLLSISGLSTIFTFTSICICHVRFRRALKVQGKSEKELGYKSHFGVYGSLYAIVLNVLILIAQFWIALYPIGAKKPDVNSFFQNYLGAIVLVVFYLGHKIYHRNWRLGYRAKDIDLDSDRKVYDIGILEQEELELKGEIKKAGLGVKLYSFFC